MDASGFVHTGTDGTSEYVSSTAVSLNAWHWYAVSVNTVTTSVNVYVDGTLLVTGVTQGVDGKESLYSPTNGSYTDFDSNKGLTGVGTAQIAALYAYDTNLTQQQIVAATSAPEPVSMALLGAGAAALLRRRKRS